MRRLITGLVLLGTLTLDGATVDLQVEAPSYIGQQATLYRYLDLFTRRLAPLARGVVDHQGRIHLQAEVNGTEKALLLVGSTGADLWLRHGTYHVQMPPPPADQVQTLAGTARVELTFLDLDHLDVNALVGDLNARLDAFLAADLATDDRAGMMAVDRMRSGLEAPVADTARSTRRPYVSPVWDEARVDSFAAQLDKFYQGVEDPWFRHDAEYGIAGLYLGPKANERKLFDRFLKGKPVLYDVPEYVRFFSAFYENFLLRTPFRSHTAALQRNLREGRTDSLKALLAQNDFLRDDRINELVLITNLYVNHAHPDLDKNGIMNVLADVRDRSIYPEHRRITANMIWDLTAGGKGQRLPMAELTDDRGVPVDWNKLQQGYSCILVTKPGNPYNDKEIMAMDKLVREYGDLVRFQYVVLDRSAEELADWRKANAQYAGNWCRPNDQRELLDLWRTRSAPALYVLHDGILETPPGLLPSQGLAAILHKVRTAAERDRQLNRDRGLPPPRR